MNNTLETLLKSVDFPVDKIYVEGGRGVAGGAIPSHLGRQAVSVVRIEPYNGSREAYLYTMCYHRGSVVFFQVVEGKTPGKTGDKLPGGHVLVQRFGTTDLILVDIRQLWPPP